MTTCDVLVVGGGLMGCAVASQLAASGAKVLVAERNAAPGQETTARSGAIIRAHYGVPELVTLALRAHRLYADFKRTTGHDIGWTACGYTVLVDEDDVHTLEDNVAMHRALGVDVDFLLPEQLKKLVPSLRVHDVTLACYEPNGGYANPAKTVAAFAALAKRDGAAFCFNAPVVGAQRARDGWRVELGNGETVSCPQVVLCTGNWSRLVGKLFGLHLPVVPVRAQITVMQRPSAFSGSFPVISDLINLAYFREEGTDGMWVGSSDMADLQEALPQSEAYNEEADAEPVQKARIKTAWRFEGFGEESPVQRGFCGLYETTPDWQPIVDSFENVHVAVGFSGHGFKLAPVVGEEMAARVLGSDSRSHDAESEAWKIFDLARFEEGRTIKSQHVYQRARFLR